MAYAAIISVFNVIKDLLDSPRISLTSSTQEILQYSYDQVWLEETLDLSWYSEVVTATNEEIIIIEEARSLQDAIESSVSAQFLHHTKICNPSFSLNLDHLKPDFDRFAQMAEMMKGRIEELWELKAVKVIEQHIMEVCGLRKNEEEDVSASSAEMVGLDDQLQELRDILDDPSIGFLTPHGWILIFITGMAGVGKTTFAKRFYNDPMVKKNFECWAFVRVGRGYWRERVTRSLNDQLNHGDEKMIEEGDSLEDIVKSLRTTFRDKSCLIVLDDLWDYHILDYVFELCESFGLGRMILVTSRPEPNYRYSRRGFKLRFLNEDESWELLRKKVFGEGEVCPRELVEPGKKIAKKCGGLPLLINAFAPILLRKVEKNPESWNRVAEKPSSILEEASLRILEVLLPSYNELDEICKLCFLYIAAFPEGYDVFYSTINNLWQAEGFDNFIAKKFSVFKKSDVFVNLFRNNLVIADHERGRIWYKIKSCILHCAYWYLNKRVARDNRFLYIMNSYADGMDEHVKSHQRLAIQTNVLLAIKEVFDNVTSISTVRSVLCTGPYNQYQVPICFEWKMLRVLDVVTIHFYEFPVEVLTLVLLRYLALTCNANLPPSISKLWKLQFLIVCQHLRIRGVGVESFVPVEIWDLQELIHLEIMGRNMPEPPHPCVVLPNLIKLLDVGIESCRKGVLGNIPNLEKVRIQIELAPDTAQDLTCLFDVKSFQCVVMNPTLLHPPSPLSVPILDGIQKLSLSGLGYPWEEMSKIAKLRNIRVLKLLSYAFRGEKWEVNEEMMTLQYLYIEDTDLVRWTSTTEENMESITTLKLKNCHKLHEIPAISRYLSSIELIDCNPLAETCAKKIHSSDVTVSVTATYSWKEKKLENAAARI